MIELEKKERINYNKRLNGDGESRNAFRGLNIFVRTKTRLSLEIKFKFYARNENFSKY